MIGNYVSYKGEPYIVSIWTFDKFRFPAIGFKLDPIQLTDEWLVKFGFVTLVSKMSGCSVFVKGDWSIATKGDGVYVLWHKKVSPPTYNLATFQYVHELQNIYFPLTKTKLTINDK